MAVALEAAGDLTAVAACFVLIAMLVAVSYTFEKLSDVLDVDILGYHPFRGISNAIRNSIIAGCQDGISALERAVDGLLTGLKDSFNLLLSLPDKLLAGVNEFASYLWNHGIDAKVLRFLATSVPGIGAAASLFEFVKAAAAKLNLTTVDQVATEVAHSARTTFDNATAYTDTAVTSTLIGAKQYADRVSRDAAVEAERYADSAVSALRTAETAAVNNALSVANAAGKAATEALATAGALYTKAEADAKAAEAAAAATFTQALAGVKSIAVGAEQDAQAVLGKLDSYGVPGIAAATVATATALAALAAETGLDNQSCRSKVKQVCGTDPNAWTNLLAGVAAVGFALDFRAVVAAAEKIGDEVVGLVKQAA